MRTSEIFEKILERPPLYLGHASVILLHAFISGYAFAKYSENSDFHDPLYDGFSRWVADRFGFGHSHSWASIISFMGVSEAKAFDLTKELWEQYKSEMKNINSNE